MLLNIYIAPL